MSELIDAPSGKIKKVKRVKMYVDGGKQYHINEYNYSIEGYFPGFIHRKGAVNQEITYHLLPIMNKEHHIFKKGDITMNSCLSRPGLRDTFIPLNEVVEDMFEGALLHFLGQNIYRRFIFSEIPTYPGIRYASLNLPSYNQNPNTIEESLLNNNYVQGNKEKKHFIEHCCLQIHFKQPHSQGDGFLIPMFSKDVRVPKDLQKHPVHMFLTQGFSDYTLLRYFDVCNYMPSLKNRLDAGIQVFGGGKQELPKQAWDEVKA